MNVSTNLSVICAVNPKITCLQTFQKMKNLSSDIFNCVLYLISVVARVDAIPRPELCQRELRRGERHHDAAPSRYWLRATSSRFEKG